MSTVKAHQVCVFFNANTFFTLALPAVKPLDVLSDELFETSVSWHAFSCSDAVLLELASVPVHGGPFVLKKKDFNI